MDDHRQSPVAPRPPDGPRVRLAATAVRLARHGRRFTGAVLLTAAVVGVGVGVAAPEVSPVAPATTAVAVAVPAQARDQTVTDGADTGHGADGRAPDGGGADGRGADGGAGGRR